jgi:hypothetical protein
MSSAPSQQKCAVWPMHEDMMQRIITQRVDETPSLKYADVVSGIGARSRSLFGRTIRDVGRRGRARQR